ncbi:hypothetical protein D3C76_917610 [compost metagenome]
MKPFFDNGGDALPKSIGVSFTTGTSTIDELGGGIKVVSVFSPLSFLREIDGAAFC